MDKETIINCAQTSMNSKLIGPEKKHFASLAVDAMLAVKVSNF
jgi:T-complex protein 1 subunit alpha